MIEAMYDLLYALPLCLIIETEVFAEYKKPDHALLIYLCAIVILVTCLILKHVENRIKYLLPGVMVMIALGAVLIQNSTDRTDFITDNVWILIAAVVSIGSFLVERLITRYPITKRIMAAGVIALLLIRLILRQPPLKLTVVMALLLILLWLSDELQSRRDNSIKADIKGHTVSVAPFILLLAVIIYIFPASAKPYDWHIIEVIRERASIVTRLAGRWLGPNDEDYEGVIGFSDDGAYWGELHGNNREMLTIFGLGGVDEQIYLTGKIMDDFDGRQWTSKYEETGRDREMDALETMNAVTVYAPDATGRYLRKSHFQISYEDFNTGYLFAPQKVTDLKGPDIYEVGSQYRSEDQLGYGVSYDVEYYRLNRSSEDLGELIREAEKNKDRDIAKFAQTYDPKSDPVDMDAYREKIYRYYLPDTEISAEVRDLVTKTTKDATDDYERLCMINDWLYSMDYTQTPGDLPAKVDSPGAFLDYFLLDQKEGYCSHYATAFVLLSRSMGIPARFVQGFRVPTGGDLPATVTGNMAHAWPECYIEGFGWIAFEPTPGHLARNGWVDAVDRSDESKAYYNKHIDETEDDERSVLDTDEAKPSSFKPSLILVPAGFALLFVILFVFMDILITQIRYRRMSITERFYALCHRNRRVLKALGYERAAGETLEELRNRAEKDIGADGLWYITDLERILYAGADPSDEMIKKAERCHGILMSTLKDRRNHIVYLLSYL